MRLNVNKIRKILDQTLEEELGYLELMEARDLTSKGFPSLLNEDYTDAEVEMVNREIYRFRAENESSANDADKEIENLMQKFDWSLDQASSYYKSVIPVNDADVGTSVEPVATNSEAVYESRNLKKKLNENSYIVGGMSKTSNIGVGRLREAGYDFWANFDSNDTWHDGKYHEIVRKNDKRTALRLIAAHFASMGVDNDEAEELAGEMYDDVADSDG